MNLIVDKQPTKLSKQFISASIPIFMKAMNLIVDDNTFDQNLKKHN